MSDKIRQAAFEAAKAELAELAKQAAETAAAVIS